MYIILRVTLKKSHYFNMLKNYAHIIIVVTYYNIIIILFPLVNY